MRKVFKIFLFLTVNVICLNSITYTKNDIIEQKIKSMAYEKIIDHASDFTGKFNDFLDQGIDYINIYITELNGENDEEAVVLAGFHYGEGGIEHYLMIYENIYTNPILSHFKNTHGTIINNNFHEITDLDNNGISEILIVGDRKSVYDKTPIFLYKLEDNKLKDMIWGNDIGSAYYHFDLDYDNIEEIICISKNDNSEIKIQVLKNKNNFYKETDLPDNIRVQLKIFFENMILSQNFDLLKQHDYEDLYLLSKTVKFLNAAPSNIPIFQENLEIIYNKTHYIDKPNILGSMLWDENGNTKAFLQNNLIEELNKNKSDLNSYIIKSIIETQLEFHDETGINLLIEYYKNKYNNYNKRKKIIYYILGDLIEYNKKCYIFLKSVYSETDDAQLKRLINLKMTSLITKHENINIIEKSMNQFDNKDKISKIKIIKELSQYNDKKALNILIKAYENPANKEIDNEIIYAISNHYKKNPGLYKKNKNIINDYLIYKSSIIDRNIILTSIGNIINKQTIIEIIKMENDNNNLQKLFSIVHNHKITNAVPYIIDIINNKNLDNLSLKYALTALSISETSDVKIIMKKHLNHKNSYIQIISIEYFANIKDYDMEKYLIDIFNNHPDKYVRCHAAKALGCLGKKNAEEILISNFKNYLNHYGYNEYIKGMLYLDSDKIKQYFINEFERLNKEKNYNFLFYICFDALTQIDSDLINNNLIEWINPEYPDKLRLRAIYYLTKLENPDSKKIIQSQLNTANRDLRKKIINTLNNEIDYYEIFNY